MKVLIVDDDVVSRMMLMHMIDSAASGVFDVLEAEDGEDAWAQLDGGADPSLLFCDLRMPRLSGMELLARVKADARFAGLPFVLVSAAADGATMEQALSLGAAGYIVKPFDATRVAQHLQPLMRAADEQPDATLRRLGIDATRLLLYLGGLQRQLVSAGTDLAALLATRQLDAARAHLARLCEGCRTLGLHGAANGFDALRDAPDGAALMRELEAAHRAVLRQTDATRHLAM
ncbi:two-component system, chemotaxis family, response regulator CheY [Massilia sp. PDC64]|nr:response regulator [Massilia sp. PDC64]SDC83377.1 two-component system, chemotaxis family, response regulator CheY [Massilia sp. PDC64]